jgi:hypothetical protein
MFKLYTIAKKKTGILGLWQDENGKIFRDNIKIKSFNSVPRKDIAKLFSKGEKAVFYTSNDLKAVCVNADYSQVILPYKIELREKTLSCGYIKELLKNHNGFTIFRENDGFKIVIYKG